jgi:hypothetical protein
VKKGQKLGQGITVRWSNFDRRDPKKEFSRKVQRRPPADIFLNEGLPHENPLADTMFMAATAMVLPRKIVENFQSYVKNTKL